METAKVWLHFFSNLVQNLKVSRFPDSDPLIRNIKDPTPKGILKYRKYPSIVSIECRFRYVSSFSFVKVNKAFQNSDMPTKVTKENSCIFSSFLCTSLIVKH